MSFMLMLSLKTLKVALLLGLFLLSFTEDFSGDESDENDNDTSEEEEKEDIMGFDIDVNDAATTGSSPLQAQDLSVSLTRNSKELFRSKHTSLVQPTISSLLTKAREKLRSWNVRYGH